MMLTRRCPRGTAGPWLLALMVIGTTVSAQERPTFKVLVVNVPDVNHATSGDAGAAAIKQFGTADGYAVDISTDYGLFTDSYLAPYDVMVWVMAAPLTWTDASRAAFEKYVRSGRGWIGLHVAGLTGISKSPWTWFDEYLGGIKFTGHPARQTAIVRIDPTALSHPILTGVASEFRVFEEWYSWDMSPRSRAGFTVLATLDETSYDVGTLTMRGDHPIVWINDRYGRMMYTGVGHEPASYSDTNLARMIRNSILWAAGQPVFPRR